MSRVKQLLTSRHVAPVGIFLALCVLYWSPVLLTGRVLLPGASLQGFAPFGSNARADWNILQWDALGQYFPWRAFAARELQSGHVPLWNPYQFSGAPFVANGQSAIFYPLNFVFWVFDVAFAFGISAFLHSVLAGLSTYFLAQRWKISRAASLLCAIAFSFCGYLAAWVMLPTLANTASWLPLCLLFFERAVAGDEKQVSRRAGEKRVLFSLSPCLALASALTCALLAGHAQVFFYILVALFLRALFLPRIGRALCTLAASFIFSLMLGALQLLPTLELARNGHRAGAIPTPGGWEFLRTRALQIPDLFSLFIPQWPQFSTSENFGYVGIGVLALAVVAITLQTRGVKFENRNLWFAFALALFGILYATATPLSQMFYYGVPGLAQMGGVGRALVLWSFGIALVVGFGLDALRRRWSTPIIPVVALILICGEVFWNGIAAHPSAARNDIYPDTKLTQFLQINTKDGARVLFLTPRSSWLNTESFGQSGRTHPAGVLPPNGAMVYGINDVNGYDSLAPRAYRAFVARRENLKPGEDVAPPLNGNMILLNNPNSHALIQLGVRYVVSQTPLDDHLSWKEVFRGDGCFVYWRAASTTAHLSAASEHWTMTDENGVTRHVVRVVDTTSPRSGKDFSPGWRDGKYQPESFRFGLFISLCALGFCAALLVSQRTARILAPR